MTVVLIITIFGDVVVVIMMVVFFYLTIKLWKEIWYGNEDFLHLWTQILIMLTRDQAANRSKCFLLKRSLIVIFRCKWAIIFRQLSVVILLATIIFCFRL